MTETLNITNGDCAAEIMRKAGVAGAIIPWRDVLYEGPVFNLSLDELSPVRSEYIAGRGWGSVDEIIASFQERDDYLKNYSNYKSVTLWFEHDLYDQLQLLQILDWFAHQQSINVPVMLICVDRYLGRLTPKEMSELRTAAQPVSPGQLALAASAWAAFCSPDPTQLIAFIEEDCSFMPYLKDALFRLIEEYPSRHNGLCRTADQLLSIINKGPISAAQVFSEYTKTEERLFMGDASFWHLVDEQLNAKPPLIALPEGIKFSQPPQPCQLLSITDTGSAVLAGKADATHFIPLNRWLGGVYLRRNNDWRWNSQTKVLSQQFPP